MTLGVHFGLAFEQAERLAALDDDAAIIAFVEEIEEAWNEENLCQTDKAWETIHHCLTGDDPANDYTDTDAGEEPLKWAILGGAGLLEEVDNYFIFALDAQQVREVSHALDEIDETEFRRRYDKYCRGKQPGLDEDHFIYTWENFRGLKTFYGRMAAAGYDVIFTVSQ